MRRLISISVLFAAAMGAQALVNGPVVIFIGPPGSGKSTQAKKAAAELKIPIISAEDMIAANPEAFQKNKNPAISGMNPRTDPALNGLFEKTISLPEYKNGVIVDGYPATKDHADYLRQMVRDGKLPNPAMLRLEITDEQLRKRLGKEANETFEQLLKDYHRELDMMDVYFPGSRVVHVDGTGTPAEVNKRVRKAIAEIAPFHAPS
jgi:adenylate kinase